MGAVKCPACGMETPEEPGYCDFCKEPFKKKASAAPPAPSAGSPTAQKTVDVPPEVFAKLLAAGKPRPPEERGPVSIPPEFAHLDAGERIEPAPPVVKTLAWAFVAVIILWSAVGLFYLAHRASSIGKAAAERRP
ncbi:MAG: hypothetical protein KGL53_07500 [Elusimicrobia bacterium]|nr:hypothetical protein [Elusimicrobiota bacterium]